MVRNWVLTFITALWLRFLAFTISSHIMFNLVVALRFIGLLLSTDYTAQSPVYCILLNWINVYLTCYD